MKKTDYIKKQELKSIIENVEAGKYSYAQHSDGAFSAGYITNYAIVLDDEEHFKKYGRRNYWVLFSSLGYGKVKTYGRTYNRSWHNKYEYYKNKVLDIVKDGKLLSKYLH